MDTNLLLSLSREALMLMVLASAPPILASLITGFLMSLFQATTSIQEASMSSVPKLAAATISLVVAGPWIGSQLSRFATQVFLALPGVAS